MPLNICALCLCSVPRGLWLGPLHLESLTSQSSDTAACESQLSLQVYPLVGDSLLRTLMEASECSLGALCWKKCSDSASKVHLLCLPVIILLFIHSPAHPGANHLSTYPPTYPLIYSSICSSSYHPSIHPSICLSIHPSSSICPSSHLPSAYQPMVLFIHLLLQP